MNHEATVRRFFAALEDLDRKANMKMLFDSQPTSWLQQMAEAGAVS